MKKETTLILKLIVALAFISGCTKTRQAELPDDVKPNIFAKSDFITPQESPYVATKELATASGDTTSMKALDSAQASVLSGDDVTVPDRLKFMFDKLPMSGQTTKQFKITFSVDKDFITSYKVVQSASELTPLEKSLAISEQEAQLISKAANSASKDSSAIMVARKAAIADRDLIKMGKKAGNLLVPMFKYKIEGFGILERTKNELKESTSILGLRKTDFASATHIQITSLPESRLLIGMNADQIKEINQLFVESKIDNQLTTAGELQARLNVGMDFFKPDTKVFTRLDSSALHLYQVSKARFLNDDELSLLKNTKGNQQVISCQDPSISKYINSPDSDCVIVLIADLAITYKNVKLTTDGQGNVSDAVQFDNVPRAKSGGLVEILENSAAKQISLNTQLDPKNAIKLSDIMNKEFFFRRTFEDAPSTSLLMPGLAGDLILVKFVLEDNRLIIRASEKFINYKNQNANQYEDLMSIDAKYVSLVTTDGNGAPLVIPTLQPTNKANADYVILDWTANSLPIVQSPLSMTTFGQCLGSMADTKVTDISVKTGAEFVLNFTYNYTSVLRPECATYYDTQNYNGGDTGTQQVHTIRERISFRENKIKKDNEKILSAQVPFPAQNQMGYGLFTKGIINPTANGNRTLGDGQLDLPIVHDFTNGQKLIYTIGGLADNDPQRQMVIDLTKEVVEDWNKALHRAFKGTSLDRSDSYIEAVVNGEGSEKGFLGDTDKNYIWYDDKINEGMSIIGVSQAGSHPRTGTIIADQVVMYLGNSRNYIEGSLRVANLAKKYKDMTEQYKLSATASLVASEKATDPAQPGVNVSPADPKAAFQRTVKAQKNYVSLVLQKSNSKKQVSSKVLAKSVNLSASLINQLTRASGESETKDLVAKLNLNPAQSPFMKDIIAKIIEAGTATNSSDIESIVARELLKSNGQLMTAEQKSLMKLYVQIAEAKSNLQKLFINRPGCASFKDAGTYDNKFTGLKFEDALKISLKATLAHEMGHSLGLTHNFIASSDKANWEFDQETTGRNYSSIMDYQDESRQVYAGPGPYDVHALRAGYVGLIEASPKIAAANPKLITTIDGKNFINVDSIKSIEASDSWSNLTRQSALDGVKNYKYCTDKDLMFEATCRQFDLGGSASEIVGNAIADYNERYGVSRFGYDRRSFGWTEKSRVLSRTIDGMLHIRQYLDEAFYKLITESSTLTDAEKDDYVDAAIKGWMFFQQVLGTPDASPSAGFLSANRFKAVRYDYADAAGAKKSDLAFVELKKLRDSWLTNDRLESVGMELDKVMATQILTMHGIGYPKYAMQRQAFSYLDLEKYLLGINKPLNMPTVSLLTSLIVNKLPAFTSNENSEHIDVDVKNEVTETMSAYASISAILSLEATTLTAKDNYANLFKVGSKLGSVVSDRLSLSRLDSPAKSNGATYFWAADNSLAVSAVLTDINKGRYLLDHAAELEKSMAKIASAFLGYSIESFKVAFKVIKESKDAGKTQDEIKVLASNAFTTKMKELVGTRTPEQIKAERKQNIANGEAELLAALQSLNKDNAIVSLADIRNNPDLAIENQAKIISSVLQQSASAILQGPSLQDATSQLAGLKTSYADLADFMPTVALAQKSVLELTADIPLLKNTADAFLDSQIIEFKDNLTMRNIEFLNGLTIMVNPGYNR